MATQSNITTSRLLTSTNDLRKTLVTRNLYTPYTEYPTYDDGTVDKTVKAINSVVSVLTPFKSYNLENTIYGRLVTNRTPLSEIGLVMLGRQFAYNAASSVQQNYLPIINVSNLFDGNKDTKLFSKNIDYKITKKEGKTNFSNFLDNVIGWYPKKDYPFTKNATNDDYLKNSGTGQLKFLFTSLNNNQFRPNNDNNNATYYEKADEADTPIQGTKNILLSNNKKYYNFTNSKFYPYQSFVVQFLINAEYSNDIANQNMINAADYSNGDYAPNQDAVESMGNTTKKDTTYISVFGQNDWIGDETEFRDNLNNNENKIVWGRDGIDDITNNAGSQYRGDEHQDFTVDESRFETDFNVKTGLLEYTRNLVIASQGEIVDMTRKAFMKGDKIVGFNGSGLYKSNNSTYIGNRGNLQGIRQHTAIDQYDKFTKAIRFNGNKLYGGNKNSVIYDSVIPRIHPTLDKEGNINNKNLMFSLENLAVKVISKDGVGIIDDEYGSQIPVCEVGPFNGRIMWFPPYALEINETTAAKFESTVMVGRGEPIYNYQNSERSAVLNFTLLIDYPPHVRNYKNSKTSHKDIAEFFAFGGDNVIKKTPVSNPEAKIKELEDKKKRIIGDDKPTLPQLNKSSRTFNIYFPNDVPKVEDNLDIIMDVMYADQYDVSPRIITPTDNTHNGLNKDVFTVLDKNGSQIESYTVDGIPYYKILKTIGFSQYESIEETDYFGNPVPLIAELKRFFENEEDRKYYKIEITGSASKLYTSDYNQKLGERRAEAAKVFIERKIQKLFGKRPDQMGVQITTKSIGETKSSNVGSSANAIGDLRTKQDRYAEIKILRNNKSPEKIEKKLTVEEQKTIEEIDKQISALESEKNKNNGGLTSDCLMNERNTSDSAILNGFSSISKNNYYPAFHSQTPEDFHKRLTFLQQCMRQGAALRYDVQVDDNNIARAKNSVFGRQPICILRVGDFFYTKVVIESLNVDYVDTPWDMNPEGFGMQPMMAHVTLNMKVMGGQSLKGPIDALQNAVSFNHYANSNFSNEGMYKLPSDVADKQESYMKGILTSERKKLLKEYENKINNTNN